MKFPEIPKRPNPSIGPPEYKSEEEQLLAETANFFDNPTQAQTLLEKHLKDAKIIDDCGEEVSLQDFHNLHEKAYKRRIEHNVPNDLKILELDLRGTPKTSGSGRVTQKTDNLERVDNKRDLGQYKGKYGIYKKDIEGE